MVNDGKLTYGPGKYAALNLLLARWIRGWVRPSEAYSYVTLGGTQLFDVVDLGWIDKQLVSGAWSYERNAERYERAKVSKDYLENQGITLELLLGDIFEYQRRESNNKHIFFIDLEGTCRLNEYRPLFMRWLQQEIIRPDDFILITSYLGRNPGWAKVLAPFDAEFRTLRLTSFQEKQRTYKLAHPLFVLYESLLRTGFEDEVQLVCVGSVSYKSRKSPMTLYGIALQEGATDLETLVSNAPHFDLIKNSQPEITF